MMTLGERMGTGERRQFNRRRFLKYMASSPLLASAGLVAEEDTLGGSFAERIGSSADGSGLS